jgi:hypothetical protein
VNFATFSNDSLAILIFWLFVVLLISKFRFRLITGACYEGEDWEFSEPDTKPEACDQTVGLHLMNLSAYTSLRTLSNSVSPLLPHSERNVLIYTKQQLMLTVLHILGFKTVSFSRS